MEFILAWELCMPRGLVMDSLTDLHAMSFRDAQTHKNSFKISAV